MTHHALNVMAGLDPAIHAFDAAHAEPQRVKTNAVWYHMYGVLLLFLKKKKFFRKSKSPPS
jgi:hypothetical protein